MKKERALQLVTLDPHGPNEMRCNGTLSNVPEFLQVSAKGMMMPCPGFSRCRVQGSWLDSYISGR